MSNITISNLQPVDLNLFSDEGYLNDLTEMEKNIQGGLIPLATIGLIMMAGGSIGVGASLGVLAARAWDKL